MEKNDDFSLGFAGSLFELTGTVPSQKNISATVEEKSYSYKTVYEWFVKDKTATSTFEQHLRTKPEVYILFNLVPFHPLPDDIMQKVEKFKNQCFADVDKNLTDNNENIEKGEQIKFCLLEIENIFKYYDSEEFNFEKDLKHYLFEKLYVSLKEKESDGVLDLSEVGALLNTAKQIYLWDGESEKTRQEILSWIKIKAAEDKCKIESYWQSFIRLVKIKPSFEKLNTEKCEEKLYWEYQSLKLQELEIYNQPIEINHDELRAEMKSILEGNKLLKDREETYLRDFFYIEQAKSGKDFSLKLPSDYYQHLKTVACFTYSFSEEQWNDFAHKHKLSKLNDLSAAFILGTQKASSIENIASLLENNKSKAIERIIDGDLETYLIHIDQRGMANEIEQAKNIFKNDRESLFKAVLNILLNKKNNDADNSIEIDDRQSLLSLISRDADIKEMVEYLLKRKTREKLNQRILGSSKERDALNEYLRHKKFSFVCLCMNYLRDFPDESNASGYANIYEMYANYVLDILIERNAFSLFFSGFCHLINQDYVSQKFKDKLNETNIKMQKDFETFCNTVNKKGKKKSIFGF